MSCHYSCQSCSSAIYENLCLSCPTNRYLVDTTCYCSSGFYEDQTSVCSSSLSYYDVVFDGIGTGLYYWFIFIFWVSVIFSLSHIFSSKTRILISFGQLIGLLTEYNYRFTYITQKSLNIFNTLNFSYFNFLFCSQ